MKIEEMIGYHLMIGIPGGKITPAIIRQFEETHALGLIVFRPNFISAALFKKMLRNLEFRLKRKLLAAVDHEGGRVIHLREGVTVFPDNWMIGNAGDEKFAAEQGRIEASELRRLGMDLNLAPTVDVLTDTFSPNIGIRSYGKEAAKVARFGAARIKAMQSGGLSACAKHFPGLGAAPCDPHLDLPVLNATWAEMRRIHLNPFLSAIAAGVDCVMTSHPVYPKLDSSKVPVTFSKKIVTNLLRQKLGFKGVILSDDLEMGALRGLCSIGESAVRAVEAGHDIVLLCHDGKAQQEAYQALLKAYREGRLKIENLKASVSRIEALLSKRRTRFGKGRISSRKKIQQSISKTAEKGIRGKKSPRFSGKKNGAFNIIFPEISKLAGRIHIEDEMLDEKKFIKDLFRGQGLRTKTIHISRFETTAADIGIVKKWVKSGDPIIFFCYDAHLQPGSREILEALRGREASSAVVFLRNPYDAELMGSSLTHITAYGFRAVQIRAAVKMLKSFLAG